MSTKPSSKPIVNTLNGKYIIGMPTAIKNTLQYDAINDVFIWVAPSTGGGGNGGIQTINGNTNPNQLISSGSNAVKVQSNGGDTIVDLEQQNATEGQVLEWSVGDDSFIPKTPSSSGIQSINSNFNPNQFIFGTSEIKVNNINNERFLSLEKQGATDKQALKWSDANSKYEPQDDEKGVESINGDSTPSQDIVGEDGIVVNDVNNLHKVGLNDVDLDKLNQEGATDGQVLKWSDANSKYEPQNP